ncbi:molecular chaperone [Pseudomonas sp. PDNC002]|nr:molecular chaperone [Pseudomonas sp. PDNC002]
MVRISDALLCLCALVLSTMAFAGVTAESTRVIFPSDLNEVAVLLVNANKYPVLVQTWMDDGGLDSTPDKAISSFMSLPPVFRLEPSERRSLRIIFTGTAALPTDRESVFWLNIHEVPPTEAVQGMQPEQQRLVVSMHTQMKVFYRPVKLAMPPEEAAGKLTFQWQQTGSKAAVKVSNPTPYYMTLTGVELLAGDKHQPLKGKMIPPFSTLPLEAEGQRPGGPIRVEFSWLDDSGNAQVTKTTLQ